MFAFLVFDSKKRLNRDSIIKAVRKYLPNIDILACSDELCQLTYNEVEMDFQSMLSRHYFIPDDNWYLSCYMKIFKELGVEDSSFLALYTQSARRLLKTSKVISLNVSPKEVKEVTSTLSEYPANVTTENSRVGNKYSSIKAEYLNYMLSDITFTDSYNEYVEKLNKVLERNER